MPKKLSPEARLLRKGIERFLNATDKEGRRPADAKFGVYAFYDYDGEPIYVGQTKERLRTRIRRHLTNQRTDAVAMNVLDPFEVAEIEVWPFWELEDASPRHAQVTLNAAEYTVFQRALRSSKFGAILNEKPPAKTDLIDLPLSLRGLIIPEELLEMRKHPDVRLARRAATFAQLARVISERSVSVGLRRVLLVQARRLTQLASERLSDFES